MGGKPGDVGHIRLAERRGLGSTEGFEVLGDSLESVAGMRDLPRMPKLNEFFITKLSMRLWDLAREPWARITGGERLMKTVRPGDLVIDHALCDGCRQCLKACPVDALSFDDLLECDSEDCIRCFCCAEVCPRGALKKKFA
jgi:NAD-dependent dihydropyrimidine dehydrogenase PreA subunit